MEKIYSEDQNDLSEKLLEIPLSMPYMADEEEFRATNTIFEKDGQTYRAIKQRYLKDTLQVVYVLDTATKTLDNTIKLWVSSLVQDEMPDSGNNSLLVKLFTKDYTQPSNVFDFCTKSKKEKNYSLFIPSAFVGIEGNLNSPPPEFV
ncbi:hypothetical protein MMU07_02725 [Aquiflexum sp. LQ15W]|uniref:hypothetical protein n=1 Tax=Cognataquiflexum nitidum TaxID=2922272 RepID=UPI001F140AE0|nr:hypothetical protein [Cognataquiflexum nitidum]MCH6198479.1 hypothetical protein [Cognataquiflexum nitidum]